MIYTIKKGDTLQDIATRFLGNPNKYIEIYNLNIANLRSGNPDLIYPGEQILIPDNDNTEKEIIKPDIAEPDEVVMEIDGQQFTGWEDISITRDLETCADSFSISSVFEAGKQPNIDPEKYHKCRISIGDELIITGFIDVVSSDISNGGISLSLSGRSLSGQLVDVSVLPPLEFSNFTLQQIANKVCQPYGIPVKFNAPVGGVIEKAVAEHGESVYSFLNRLANQKGLLITSENTGALLFIRLNKNGVPVGQIEEGKGKFKSSSIEYNMQERFTNIIVDGQYRDGGSFAQGKASDNALKQNGVNRTLMIEPPDTPEANDLNIVAKWEISKRKAQSQNLSVTLSDWKNPDTNKVYKENEKVLIKIPTALILDPVEYIISSAGFNRSNGGSSCELSLIPPDAYEV